MSDETLAIIEPEEGGNGKEHLLASMLTEEDGVEEREHTELLASLMPALTPRVGAIAYPPDRAVREASLASDTSWREQEAGLMSFLASNALEVVLGTIEHPPDVTAARQQILKLGEGTVLTARLLLGLWHVRRAQGLVAKNGSVPILISEVLHLRGIEKHSRAPYQGSTAKYTDGYRAEHKRGVLEEVALLAAFHVQGTFMLPHAGKIEVFEVKGPYLRHSIVTRKGRIVGFLVSPGDWINTYELTEVPSLVSVDEQILRLNPQNNQHALRIALYLVERWLDQAQQGLFERLGHWLEPRGESLLGTAGGGNSHRIIDALRHEDECGDLEARALLQDLSLPMSELLSASMIEIDRKHLRDRFAPRIEHAIDFLGAEDTQDGKGKETQGKRRIVGEALPLRRVPEDLLPREWASSWLGVRWVLLPPGELMQAYRAAFRPPVAIPPEGANTRKTRTKRKGEAR
jgi:hypothetical protein